VKFVEKLALANRTQLPQMTEGRQHLKRLPKIVLIAMYTDT